MAALFKATFPQAVRTLALMAAPIDFSGDESLLQVCTREEYYGVDSLIDTLGNCPAPFLRHIFPMMKPVQNYVTKYSGFLEWKDDERFIENSLAMEKWTNDNIPVAGETFRDFVNNDSTQRQDSGGFRRVGKRGATHHNIFEDSGLRCVCPPCRPIFSSPVSGR